MTDTIYTCPYCGTTHSEPMASCCGEQGHCEPRSPAYAANSVGDLKQQLSILKCFIHDLEWKDYQTQFDKDRLNSYLMQQMGIYRELATRQSYLVATITQTEGATQ